MIELVRAGALGGEPDGAGFCFPHFSAVTFREQRIGEAVKLRDVHATGKIDAGGDVAPLVAATDLEIAIVLLLEINKIVRHYEHVAELGVADAAFALQAAFDRVFGEHYVHGKMFADVAEEFEIAERADPIEIVDQ